MKDLVLIPVHTKPEDSLKELDELHDVVDAVRKKWGTDVGLIVWLCTNQTCEGGTSLLRSWLRIYCLTPITPFSWYSNEIQSRLNLQQNVFHCCYNNRFAYLNSYKTLNSESHFGLYFCVAAQCIRDAILLWRTWMQGGIRKAVTSMATLSVSFSHSSCSSQPRFYSCRMQLNVHLLK